MRLSILLITAAAGTFAAAATGPEKGFVLAAGGGALGHDVLKRFIDLAGGPDAAIVLIPTANGLNSQPPDFVNSHILQKAGARNITVVHTTNRKIANTKTFVEPLRKARGVWFDGGRQWRLVD